VVSSDSFGGMNREAFAQSLKRIRKTRSLKQSELGAQIGVSNLMISRYESGRAIPRLDRFAALCRALECTPGELLPGLAATDAG